MPKATSPFLSSLSGSLRGGPTFRNTTQTDKITMQTRPVPTDRRTAKQAAVRDAYARLAWLWKNLSSLDKEPYEIMAEARNLTPWNCWLSFHMPLMRLTPKFYTVFAEGAGTSITDFAIGGQSGTINGPVWQEKNQFPCLSFDGVDDRVIFARPSYYDSTTPFTLFCMGIPPTPSSDYGTLLSTKYNGSKTGTFWFAIRNNGQLLYEWGTGTNAPGVLSVDKVSFNNLNAMGIIRNGNSITFYVNEKSRTVTTASAGPVPSTLNFSIGTNPNGLERYKGPLMLVSKFNSVLTVNQLTSLERHYRPFFT